MEIKLYCVPVSSFPRMSYAYNNSTDIIRDCNEFARSRNMKENEISTYENVFVNICKNKKDSHFPVEISDVVKQEDTGCLKENTNYFDSLDILLKQQTTHPNALSVAIVSAKYHDEIYKKHKDDDLKVFLSETESSKKSEGDDLCQIFSRRDQIKRDIGNLLERRVLQPMKEICECLLQVRTSIDVLLFEDGEPISVFTPLEDDVKKKEHCDNGVDQIERNGVKTRMSTRVKYTKCMNEDDSSNYKESKSRKRKVQSGTLTGESTGKKFCPVDHLQRQALSNISFLKKADRETVDKLLKSILALYQMTNIPKSQQPELSEYQPKQLDEKLCSKLFSLSKSIKGMGYNSSILVILLSENVGAKEKVEEKIAKVLHPQKVAYKIERVSDEMQLLMHVGAKLEPVPCYGTLGCFAKMGGTKTCILLSKHVAIRGQEMYFENKRKVCKIIEDTTREETGDLDIAAAEIYPTETVCSTQFRDSSGKEMKGILHLYNGEDKLITESRKVHIWGACSKPGKGEIKFAACKYRNEECQQTLMQIKDGESKFIQPGDSGAIVCADDPDGNFVHVIGMVMGEGIGQNVRTYYALPLSDGLKQLEKKTGQRFALY